MKNIKPFKKFNENANESVVKLVTPEELDKLDVVDRDYSVILYPEQLVPIRPKYQDVDNLYYVSNNDIELNEYFIVKKGDKIYLEVSSPANGSAVDATSYKLVNNRTHKSIALLNVIPHTAKGGELNDSLHFDAITQIKNLDLILKGELETYPQSIMRKIKIVETLIPETDFWVAKPYNVSHGFEHPHKVIVKDGKFLYLRDVEWITKEQYFKETKKELKDEYEFNVWREYNSKEDLAWSIYMNAFVILQKSDINQKSKYFTKWDELYDKISALSKAQYTNSK